MGSQSLILTTENFVTNNARHLVETRPAYFLDFEASSLAANSWPVEIGIARVIHGAVETESYFINPHSDCILAHNSAKTGKTPLT
jgi:hypothetical protein